MNDHGLHCQIWVRVQPVLKELKGSPCGNPGIQTGSVPPELSVDHIRIRIAHRKCRKRQNYRYPQLVSRFKSLFI